MRALLINPPYRAVTSKLGVGEQVPLGLLSIGGPIVDAGHTVRLMDAEARHLTIASVVREATTWEPDIVLTGHSGSTPAHLTAMKMAQALKQGLPRVPIVYGGVHPTYHAEDILREEPQIDYLVRGEGEETIVNLLQALATGADPKGVRGIAGRVAQGIFINPTAAPIADLDAARVGWELLEDWDFYRCWGLGRSALIQLSRGCPHLCSYCGQRGFWTRQRYRTPEKVAQEIGWLHRTHGVRFVDLADENPTTSKKRFRRFLEALIAERVDVKLFATLRADDIVRDADILHLYKQAGFECFLMGMETTDAETQTLIRKGSTIAKDREAVQLLRQHGIISMMGHVVGFEEETDRDYWTALKQILFYDPDLINAMYVTPHRWTPYYAEIEDRGVIQPDLSKWDYRHQVLSTPHIPAWRVFLWVKFTEMIISFRPVAIWRIFAHRDRSIRRALQWCFWRSGLVWLDEITDFMFRDARLQKPVPLRDIRGLPEPHKEYVLSARSKAAGPSQRAA